MTETTEAIRYRFLSEPAEWGRLSKIFAEHKAEVPTPETSAIVVAEVENEIVGFLVLQVQLHTEPLWIHPRYRGVVSWRRMLEEITTLVQSGGQMNCYYTFADNSRMESLLQRAHYRKLPYTVWVKEIRHGIDQRREVEAQPGAHEQEVSD